MTFTFRWTVTMKHYNKIYKTQWGIMASQTQKWTSNCLCKWKINYYWNQLNLNWRKSYTQDYLWSSIGSSPRLKELVNSSAQEEQNFAGHEQHRGNVTSKLVDSFRARRHVQVSDRQNVEGSIHGDAESLLSQFRRNGAPQIGPVSVISFFWLR